MPTKSGGVSKDKEGRSSRSNRSTYTSEFKKPRFKQSHWLLGIATSSMGFEACSVSNEAFPTDEVIVPEELRSCGNCRYRGLNEMHHLRSRSERPNLISHTMTMRSCAHSSLWRMATALFADAADQWNLKPDIISCGIWTAW